MSRIVICGAILLALVAMRRWSTTRAGDSSIRGPAAVPMEPGAAAPDVIERDGLVGRRVGRMRVYLAAQRSVELAPADIRTLSMPVAGGPTLAGVVFSETRLEQPIRQGRAVELPILLVFENDSYGDLSWNHVGGTQREFATIRIERLDGDAPVTVFRKTLPQPAVKSLPPAARRTVVVEWPLRDAGPGIYRITAGFFLLDAPVLQLDTRLY